jgi:penicillin-binding protein 1A
MATVAGPLLDRNMRTIARFLGFLFATGAIIFVIGAGVLAAVIWKFEQDLPDYSQLKNYEPPVMTRVHAADGSLLAEYARERRLYLPRAAGTCRALRRSPSRSPRTSC